MRDVFFISDMAAVIQDRLNDFLRRQVDKLGGSPAKRGHNCYPRIKRMALEDKMREIYRDEKDWREFWKNNRKILTAWAKEIYFDKYFSKSL